MRDAFRLQRMQSGLKIQYECIKAFSETDLTQDLKKFDVPTLIIHSDDDQIVPIVAAYNSSKLFETATLKVYEGGPHGLANTHKGTGSTPTCWTSSESEMQPTPPGRDIDVRRTP